MLHTQEVTGSSPVLPTISSVLSEELPLRELLEGLLGPEGRRRLELKHMTNDQLFTLYESELMLRVRNARNLTYTKQVLARFKDYIGDYPPSPQLAKGFLAQFADRKARTFYSYAQMMKSFMKWYGEPMNDLKVKVPHSIPSYTEDGDIGKLLSAIENKKTHKACIVRDLLLAELALNTGLRRGELANLTPKDIHADFLIVRNGKGEKDRVLPLGITIGQRLHKFIESKDTDKPIFGLKAPCISNKISQFAKKAGVSNVHAHTLRHKFATDLLEQGVNVKVVQTLLGHESLATTEVYLSITNKSLRDAIDTLGKAKPNRAANKVETDTDNQAVKEATAEDRLAQLEAIDNVKMFTKQPSWEDVENIILAPETRKEFAPGKRARCVQRKLGEAIAKASEKAEKE